MSHVSPQRQFSPLPDRIASNGSSPERQASDLAGDGDSIMVNSTKYVFYVLVWRFVLWKQRKII